MNRTDKDLMRKAANEIKYLTEDVKVIIGISERYFLYNVTTDMFKADISLPYSQWFSIPGSEEFNNYIKEKCSIATMTYGEFSDEEKQYICSESGVMVVILKRLSKSVESKLATTPAFADLYSSIETVVEGLNTSILTSVLSVDLFNSIMECIELSENNKLGNDISSKLSKMTEVVSDLLVLI